jgi:syntaxin 18
VLAKKNHARYPFGALGKWAAGGGQVKSEEEQLDEARIRSTKVHRESVIWYLQRELEECGELQRGMMETRLVREVEKSKSALYKTQVTAGSLLKINGDASNFSFATGTNETDGSGKEVGHKGVQMDEQETKEIEEQLSPEQLQLFAQENQDMLRYYEDTLDQVRYV